MNIIPTICLSMPVRHEFDMNSSRHRLVHTNGSSSEWVDYRSISTLDVGNLKFIGTTDFFRGTLPMIGQMNNWTSHPVIDEVPQIKHGINYGRDYPRKEYKASCTCGWAAAGPRDLLYAAVRKHEQENL